MNHNCVFHASQLSALPYLTGGVTYQKKASKLGLATVQTSRSKIFPTGDFVMRSDTVSQPQHHRSWGSATVPGLMSYLVLLNYLASRKIPLPGRLDHQYPCVVPSIIFLMPVPSQTNTHTYFISKRIEQCAQLSSVGHAQKLRQMPRHLSGWHDTTLDRRYHTHSLVI